MNRWRLQYFPSSTNNPEANKIVVWLHTDVGFFHLYFTKINELFELEFGFWVIISLLITFVFQCVFLFIICFNLVFQYQTDCKVNGGPLGIQHYASVNYMKMKSIALTEKTFLDYFSRWFWNLHITSEFLAKTMPTLVKKYLNVIFTLACIDTRCVRLFRNISSIKGAGHKDEVSCDGANGHLPYPRTFHLYGQYPLYSQ